tara:strand:- start:244 stop:510 length:267 start_codon:yes stop_codon:yes gene_type:complete
MKKEDVVMYLGNRGHDKDINDITKAKRVDDYVFIQFSYPALPLEEDIELYDLTDIYGECVDAWFSKDFDWEEENLKKLIKQVEDQLYG